ncbi:exported protein of unknown function [Micropruina glycogenica]|uniref:Uncharacterized protein n=1 Tax=Micropruina glycogenica TaxID=75385 RepID=A0A2N9JGC0_9ACTN|nr:exported protein of unknown function [Micropruina glycogenica]
MRSSGCTVRSLVAWTSARSSGSMAWVSCRGTSTISVMPCFTNWPTTCAGVGEQCSRNAQCTDRPARIRCRPCRNECATWATWASVLPIPTITKAGAVMMCLSCVTCPAAPLPALAGLSLSGQHYQMQIACPTCGYEFQYSRQPCSHCGPTGSRLLVQSHSSRWLSTRPSKGLACGGPTWAHSRTLGVAVVCAEGAQPFWSLLGSAALEQIEQAAIEPGCEHSNAFVNAPGVPSSLPTWAWQAFMRWAILGSNQ